METNFDIDKWKKLDRYARLCLKHAIYGRNIAQAEDRAEVIQKWENELRRMKQNEL